MLTSDPIEILLKHNRWATRNILETCATLPVEQFHQRYEIGPGSLHDTIGHILVAMGAWGDLLAGREQQQRRVSENCTPQELLSLLDKISDDFEASAGAHAHDELVSGSLGGKHYTITRGGVLAHITTHGMHHRAQCLNLLRRLGVDPLPPSTVVQWMMTAD